MWDEAGVAAISRFVTVLQYAQVCGSVLRKCVAVCCVRMRAQGDWKVRKKRKGTKRGRERIYIHL